MKRNKDDSLEVLFNINSQSFVNKVFWTMLIIELAFIPLDYFFNYSMIFETTNIRRLFNVAKESSIPTWFSSFQMLLVGFTMFLIYLRNKKKPWAFFAGFFAFLSVDDIGVIHERLGSYFKDILEASDSSAASGILDFLPSFGWQIFVVPVYGAIGIALMLFIFKELESKHLKILFFTGLAFFLVAIRIDYYEGVDGFFEGIAQALDVRKYTVSHYSKIIEETMEMIGTTCILTASLKHLFSNKSRFGFFLSNKLL